MNDLPEPCRIPPEDRHDPLPPLPTRMRSDAAREKFLRRWGPWAPANYSESDWMQLLCDLLDVARAESGG